MDLTKLYAAFIESRRPLEGRLDVWETHHIRPRSLRGTDEPNNLIRLSLGDHLFAHMLLARIHGGKMLLALALMLNDGNHYQGRRSRAQFERIKAAWRVECGASMRGQKQSPEHLAARAAAMRGNRNTLGYRQSEEHKAKRIRPAGWRHTPETRARQRELALARTKKQRR
jgi:hypothetical protein